MIESWKDTKSRKINLGKTVLIPYVNWAVD